VAPPTDSDELAGFLIDAAHVPGGHARGLYRPETEAEVAAIFGDPDGGPVLVIGSQSSLTGGATPRGERLLSTARMTTIGPPVGDAIVVDAGVVLAELAHVLDTRGRWYPPMPTYAGATVGGTVATNAAGAATFK
jgi:FAD/FMN-containing dehydrogenase